jgi:Holliday junction resolvasome RuvABC DNA-binding subunit
VKHPRTSTSTTSFRDPKAAQTLTPTRSSSSAALITVQNTAATHAQAFRALRGLGFRETETHPALAGIRARPELRGASIEKILRDAIGRLTASTQVRTRGVADANASV